MEDLTGKQLNQYQIVAALGEGGMAAVYQAYQPSMERYVALKILPRQLANDPQFMGRFEQEARVIASLQHPHILPVFDYGEADGYTYIVMPYVESGTLSGLLKGQPLGLSQIRSIGMQVGDALDYAHSRGIVHRDIKPSNILIDERGNCLLADFGIAKMVEGTAQFTQTGGIVGTPAYMSPEQGLGKRPDGRSDLYSFGVVLYEMATGRPPYQAETPMAVVIKHIHDPLPPPRKVNPRVGEGLEKVILKALAKNPEERYASGGALVEALAALTEAQAAAAVVEVPGEMSTVIERPAAAETTVEKPDRADPVAVRPIREQRPERRRWVPWAAAGVGVLGVGIIGVLLVWYIFGVLMGPGDDQPGSALVLATDTEAVVEVIVPTETEGVQAVAAETEPAEVTGTTAPTETPELTPEAGDTRISPVDGSVMVYVPAGEFIMGSGDNDPEADNDEIPQSIVYLDAFWIDQYEVTNRQYQECVAGGGCTPPHDPASATRYTYYGDPVFDDHPVINVNWFDASSYCEWRNARLPTEAEWEKAARGDDGAIYPWGDTFQELHSNYCASSIACPDAPQDGFEDTAPVGSFAVGSSPYGVHDMAGNVNEWVADWYDENYYSDLVDGIENPGGPDDGEKRGIRGGSFGLNATKLRTTNRGSAEPDHFGPYDGFRCALTP